MKRFLFFLIMTFSLSVFAGQKYKFELSGGFKEITNKLPDKSSFSSLNTYGALSDNRGNIGKYEEVIGKKSKYAITFFNEIVFIKAIS